MHHWLELDNNPRQKNMDDFNKQKICYSETNDAKETKIYLDDEKYVTDKTCFILIANNDELTKRIYEVLSSPIFT